MKYSVKLNSYAAAPEIYATKKSEKASHNKVIMICFIPIVIGRFRLIVIGAPAGNGKQPLDIGIAIEMEIYDARA